MNIRRALLRASGSGRSYRLGGPVEPPFEKLIMGAIEDLRKPLHRESVRFKLEMLEKRMDSLDSRMNRLESSIEQKFDRAERNAEARMNQLLVVLGLEERVKRLEEERHQ